MKLHDSSLSSLFTLGLNERQYSSLYFSGRGGEESHFKSIFYKGSTCFKSNTLVQITHFHNTQLPTYTRKKITHLVVTTWPMRRGHPNSLSLVERGSGRSGSPYSAGSADFLQGWWAASPHCSPCCATPETHTNTLLKCNNLNMSPKGRQVPIMWLHK